MNNNTPIELRMIRAEARIKLLTEVLIAFRDARAGSNEHGTYWLTDKLRKADAALDEILKDV